MNQQKKNLANQPTSESLANQPTSESVVAQQTEVSVINKQTELAQQDEQLQSTHNNSYNNYTQKKPKKPILLILSSIVLISVLAVSIFQFINKNKIPENYNIYLKDGELHFYNYHKKESYQLTERFFDDAEMEDYVDMEDMEEISQLISFSKDKEKMFFVDKISDDSFGLYYKNTKNLEEEAIKVDSNVLMYSIDDSANIVTYAKKADYDEFYLYQYDIKKDEKQKIDYISDLFYVSNDGKKIYYVNDERTLYFYDVEKDEKEKIDSDIDSIEHCSEDLSNIFYMKEDSLYKKSLGKEKLKISSNLTSVIKAYDSGEAYYLKESQQQIKYAEFIQDDMKQADSEMVEPTRPLKPTEPTEPSYWDYYWGYGYDYEYEYEQAYEEYELEYEEYLKEYEEYEKEYENYEKEYEEYSKKLFRDNIREKLLSHTIEKGTYSLYYFNGIEEKKITDTYNYSDYNKTAKNSPTIIFKQYKKAEIPKINLSEIETYSDYESVIEELNEKLSQKEVCISIKDKLTLLDLDLENVNLININDSGNKIYFIKSEDEYEDEIGDLYSISVSNNTISQPVLYDKDVFVDNNYFIQDDKFVYFKDVTKFSGSLYINKEKIDDDVNVYNSKYYDESNKLIYFTNWVVNKEYGTLNVFDGKNSVKIDDDVTYFYMLPNGDISYIYDFSIDRNKGTLYIYKNGKKEKIDDDVSYIINENKDKYKKIYL